MYFFRFCTGDIDVFIDVFLGIEATMEEVIQAGSVIFQDIYQGLHTELGELRCSYEIKDGCRLYQTRDSTSDGGRSSWLAPPVEHVSEPFGRTLGEPIPTLDPMAPEKLLKAHVAIVMEIATTGAAVARRMESHAVRLVEHVQAHIMLEQQPP